MIILPGGADRVMLILHSRAYRLDNRYVTGEHDFLGAFLVWLNRRCSGGVAYWVEVVSQLRGDGGFHSLGRPGFCPLLRAMGRLSMGVSGEIRRLGQALVVRIQLAKFNEFIRNTPCRRNLL